MSRPMFADLASDTEFNDIVATLFDVKRIDTDPAPVTYLRPRTTEFVPAEMLNAVANVVSVSVSDGDFVPEFED